MKSDLLSSLLECAYVSDLIIWWAMRYGIHPTCAIYTYLHTLNRYAWLVDTGK